MTVLTQILEADGPFASVLVDVSTETETGAQERDLRVRACVDALREQGAPDTVVDRVEATLGEPVHEPAPRARYLVADVGGDLLVDEVLATRVGDPVAAWEPLPDLWPACVDRAESLPVVLVSVDHLGGTVATYDSRALDLDQREEVDGEDLHAQKVRGGGMAHRRMQQRSENVWRDNAREVAEVARGHVSAGARLVVVSGSPESREEVRAGLAGTPAEVVLLDRSGESDDGGEEALALAVRTVVEQHLEEGRRSLVETVQERIGQDHAVATDVQGALDALALGQVETLAVAPDRLASETIELRRESGLDLPGVADQSVRADLGLVALGLNTGANVVPLPRDVERPVVALLRWDAEDSTSQAASSDGLRE